MLCFFRLFVIARYADSPTSTPPFGAHGLAVCDAAVTVPVEIQRTFTVYSASDGERPIQVAGLTGEIKR
jgi:hypothetical protein